MSSIEYRILLHKISHYISWLDDGETLLSVSLFERLIAADSVNNIENAASLFAEMERQNNLGIDHLSVLKELFRGVQKWTLIDEIEKFEVKRKKYNSLLEKVILKLGKYDLSHLIEICGRHLAADRKDDINNVRALLRELENTKRLGANHLDVLKEILTETQEKHLLKEVEDFERKRKDEDNADRQRMESETRREARAAAVYAVPRAVGRMMGAVNVHCNFKTVGGVVVAVGAGVVLYKYSRGDSDIQQFAHLFNEAILPAATNLCAIGNGSLCFTVQAENRSALQMLWQQYRDGTLQENLQEFLVTEEIIQLADGETVIVTVYIDKQEFQDACLDLMMGDEVFSNEEDGRLRERMRRNSDSVIYVKPKENEVAEVLSRLKQAEIKFQQERIERLEKEISGISNSDASSEEEHVRAQPGAAAELIDDDLFKSRRLDTDSSYGSQWDLRFEDFEDDVDLQSDLGSGELEGSKEVDVGREAHLSFATGKLRNKRGGQLLVKVQAPSGNLLKTKFEDSGDGTCTVSFTPDTVGPHSVSITVNGQPLTGSPWSVQVSPHQYKHILTFGSRGRGPGQFISPHGISINEKTDHIAVADTRNNRVQIFSADGSHLREFGQKGNKAERLRDPRSVAFTDNGDLIVVDRVSGMISSRDRRMKISLFSESGKFVKQITNKRLKEAWRLSVTPDGNIVVYDWGDKKIKVFSPDGAELIQSFSADLPDDIIYHQEKFFASYCLADCVKVYNKEGVFLHDIGSRGSGNGQLRSPYGLAIDKFNNLIVCDSANHRLQVFTLDGKFVNTIGETLIEQSVPKDVAVSRTSRVYVAVDGENCVYLFE